MVTQANLFAFCDALIALLGMPRGKPRRPLMYRLTQSFTPCKLRCSDIVRRDHGFVSVMSNAATAIALPTWNSNTRAHSTIVSSHY